MDFVIFLVPLVLVVFAFFYLVGRQSTSVQNSRKFRSGPWQDTGSELSTLSINPPQDVQPTSSDSVHEAAHMDISVANYPGDNVGSIVSVDSVDYGYSSDLGGALGSALGDAIDGSGGSSGSFDGGNFSGSGDFGGSGSSDGSSS